MTRPVFPKHTEPVISRRTLLGSATALTAANLVPNAKAVEAAQAVRSVSTGMTSQAIPNYSAYRAPSSGNRSRNKLRQAYTLPALSIPNELRRMKRAEDEAEFNRFAASRRRAVWDQVLKTRRELEGDPNWRPSWSEGLAISGKWAESLGRFRAEGQVTRFG